MELLNPRLESPLLCRELVGDAVDVGNQVAPGIFDFKGCDLYPFQGPIPYFFLGKGIGGLGSIAKSE